MHRLRIRQPPISIFCILFLLDRNGASSSQHDVPPPPPPAAEAYGRGAATDPGFSSARSAYDDPRRRPIHYQFPDRNRPASASPSPSGLPGQADFDTQKGPAGVGDEEFASARNDAIGRYTASTKGRLLLLLSTGAVGGACGAFVGKSVFNHPWSLATPFFLAFLLFANLRNAYGEFLKTLGMTLILAVQRSQKIRRNYPTWRHAKASIGASQRRPFPPTRNPWNYSPREGDADFRMIHSTAAMALVGSACGGNLPLIPSWLGALGGAGVFGLACTMQSARGDLCRSMGMRVVSLGTELIDINKELSLLGKFGSVSGKVFDKVMIFDRKHRIKDRLASGASWAFDKASRTASNIQNDMDGEADSASNRRDDDEVETDSKERRPRGDGGAPRPRPREQFGRRKED